MMATGYQYELGFDDSRFEIVVSQRFHCPICFLVLKDPVMCKNQHYGCSSCIKRHLESSEFCPTCLEHLSVDTLSPAPRIVTDYISELNIHCDFHSRGCLELVQVGNLKRHVASCGFSPVQCSNDGCDVLVNARDKLHHEAEVCDFRRLKCHDCGRLMKEVREMSDKMMARQNQAKDEMLFRQNRMNDEILVRQSQITEQIKTEVGNEVEGMKGEMKQVKIEMKGMKNEIKNETKGMKAGVKEMKIEMKELKNETKGVKSGMKEMKNEMKGEMRAEMRGMKEEMKEELKEMRQAMQVELKGEMQEELKEMRQAMQVELKGEMKEVIIEMKGMKNEIKNEMKGMKKEMKGINEMREVMKEMKDEIKFEMKEEVKKEMMEVFLSAMQSMMDGRKDENQSPQPPSSSDGRASIIVAGGRHTEPGYISVRSASVEIFQWLPQSWKMLNPMLSGRSQTSSFVHEGHMIVAGGIRNGFSTDSVESLNVADPVATWKESAVKLPGVCFGHKVAHRNDQLIMSGGWVKLTGNVLETLSDGVYDIQLVPPYITKMLTRLPKPVSNHGMELFDEKLFILGGGEDGKTTDSVVEYDLVKNECREMPPLPYEVQCMATVLWQNNVLVLGGLGAKSTALSSVVMYDVITGHSRMLPSMKHKRRGCTAVLTGNVVVVMGGQDEKAEYLKSVECFDLERQVWEDLPDMLEARAFATATAIEGT